MNKILPVFVLVVVGLGLGWYALKGQTRVPATRSESMVEEAATGPSGMMEETDEAMIKQGETKEFTLDSFEFGYDQKTLTVAAGDTVTITLTNSGTMVHDWVVDEFNARTKRIKNGETDSVTFVADKAGTYEFYCSVGNHRAQGMVGKLIVEQAMKDESGNKD